jgi:hypothetical protein
MTAVDLTPGEALVLLEPNRTQGREAVKVSLMWLLAKKFLTATLERKPGLFGRFSATQRLLPNPRPQARLPFHLVELMQVVRGASYMDDFVRAARKRFGSDLNGFQEDCLLPSLLERRLVEHRIEPLLWVFKRGRYYRTCAGEALRTQIEGMFTDARQIPHYLDRNPAQAAAMAATLGGLIFLMPELKPHFDEIATATRRANPIDGGYSATYMGDTSSSSPHRGEPLKDGAMELDFSAFDLGALDGLDAGMSALDASFDAGMAAGDGGGGGGGD